MQLISGLLTQQCFISVRLHFFLYSRRQIICKELCILIHRFYHLLYGRNPCLIIDTNILRVNRQAYTESVWVLYGRNVFEIDFSASTSPRCRPYPVIRANPIHQPNYGSRNERRGMIFPHCLRRMRQIILVLAGESLRVPARMEPYLFFSIGDLAVLTPRILSADAGDDWTLQEAILESGEEAVNNLKERPRRTTISRAPRLWHFACYGCRDPNFVTVKIQAENSRAPRRGGDETEVD